MKLEEMINKVICGDCLIKLKELEDNSVDSIVTDPPYHLVSIVKRFGGKNSRNTPAMETKEGGVFARKAKGFMGKEWDGVDENGMGIAHNVDMWKECFRVLKPGGHLLAFSGTRTYHRMASAIEDAGFEVRDMIEWVYGSGFPKSLNIGKAVDKLQGNKREVIGRGEAGYQVSISKTRKEQGYRPNETNATKEFDLTKGTSEWEGWGTALKPAHEPIVLARKPLSEKTVAENVLKWKTGGINIDESRVETEDKIETGRNGRNVTSWKQTSKLNNEPQEYQTLGRFPANLIHDNSEEVRECFPETKSGGGVKLTGKGSNNNIKFQNNTMIGDSWEVDSGSASRFFKSIIYQAKASKSERNMGCDEPNRHPTIKPITLMAYLIKMVTRKGGIVLDPFAGSGSTLVAAKRNGFQYIGIEMTEEYIPIIEARLNATEEQFEEIQKTLF